ncbi:MAG: lysophospholipid acyltransferase family protein [Planctomycetia bacterium]|nr:lysophospholipid acyltransferase family protein [Planctomycetia bacterium]
MKLEAHPVVGLPVSLAVYAAFLVARAGVLLLPEGAARVAGRLMGGASRFVLPGRARTARRNAEAALGPGGAAAARESFRHFGEVLVEMVRAHRLFGGDRWKDRIVFEGLEHVDAALAQGRGVIVTGAHLGNWEAAGWAMSLRGYRVNTVVKPSRNRFIRRKLESFRRATGQATIDKKGAMREAIRALRRNEILAILADQHARRDSIEVPWFGRPAKTYRTPATLSLRYKAPIVTFAAPRLPDGRIRLVFDAPFVAEEAEDAEEAIRRATARIAAALEARIRETPGQWLWMHRRWR